MSSTRVFVVTVYECDEVDAIRRGMPLGACNTMNTAENLDCLSDAQEQGKAVP